MSDDKLWKAILARDLGAVSAMIHRSTSMIDLDPEKVLRSPWLWDAKTVQWANRAVDLRARLGLEQRDEQRERYSPVDEASGMPKSGPL